MSPNPACSLHSNSAVPLHLLPLPGEPGQQLCAALPRPARQPLCALLFGAQRARDHPLYVSQGRHLPLSCRRQNGEAQRYCAGTCTGAAAHAGLPCSNGNVCRQSQSAAVLLRHGAAAPCSLFLLPQQPPTIRAAPLHLARCPLQVRLWDLRVNGCQALLEAPGLPTTTFDEQGLVFAVGAERGVVKLYDARNWAAGPFTSFPVSFPDPHMPCTLSLHALCARGSGSAGLRQCAAHVKPRYKRAQ
jgi:hypothetical protein